MAEDSALKKAPALPALLFLSILNSSYLIEKPGSGGELHSSRFIMQQPITILIADDSPHMRQSLKLLLSSQEAFRLIAEACNGEEAIAMVAEFKPDILLIDINMSPVNGFEATRKILKQNPATRIIALSLHKEPSYCRNMLRLGAKGYVSKSSSHGEILNAIKEVAVGGRYVDKNIEGVL